MNKNLRGALFLGLAALIWGTSFVAQRSGMEYIGPFTFTSIRCLIGSAALLPAALIYRKQPEGYRGVRDTVTGGILCGTVLTAAVILQQVGLIYTTAGKSGFITTFYIVLVPILGFIFLRKKPKLIVWICVGAALAGLYLLSVKDGFSVGKGELYTLGCALMFSVHILLIDRYSQRVNGVLLSFIQFLFAGIVSGILMFVFETPDINAILDCAFPLVYTGVMSTGLAYTFQILGQRDTDPTLAVLIMCFESVFAALSGWLILHETLSLREIAGCVLIFAAVIVSQLSAQKKEKTE